MAKDPKKMRPSKAAKRWIRKAGTDIGADRELSFSNLGEARLETSDEAVEELVLRNKFLGFLAQLAESPTASPAELLWTLEVYAGSTDTPEDARYHQLRGLLRIVGAVAKDPELSELFTDSNFGK